MSAPHRPDDGPREQQLHDELVGWVNDKLAADEAPVIALIMLHVATLIIAEDLGDEAEAIAYLRRVLDRASANEQSDGPACDAGPTSSHTARESRPVAAAEFDSDLAAMYRIKNVIAIWGNTALAGESPLLVALSLFDHSQKILRSVLGDTDAALAMLRRHLDADPGVTH